ncbi:MAG: hypothetical protein K1000chlam2_00936 [Chlamydiae bacterium]|nr:hypothetical protein [Chlamydiota bacterium]
MRLLFLLLILSSLLTAEIPTSSISSENASYDGNALVLTGSVNLNHALGRMQAGAARLLKDTEEGPFSSIRLRDNVLITLKNRGKISCAEADFDFSAMKGKLLPKLGDSIRFINLHSGPLSLSSSVAEIEFAKEYDALKVTKIFAHEKVHVQYGKDFVLLADNATYLNDVNPHVFASPHCVLIHFQDQIEAEKIELFPENSKIILSSPSGKFQPSAFSKNDGMQFSCDKLVWERAPQILTLRGNISIQDEGIGNIHCDDEVELRQKEQDEKWVLSSITAKGKTELQYHLSANFKHLLTCYGQMHLDQDRLVLNIESPEDQPIEYIHDQMKLRADHATLEYEQEHSAIRPQKLTLNGHVHLFADENALRCAVADQFTYYPELETMVLSAEEGQNVLFWDEIQKLSISAKEVHLSRDEKGENFKGVGNVRFAFSSTENALLKKLFPFYQQTGTANE